MVKKSTIKNVIYRVTWKHVFGPVPNLTKDQGRALKALAK